MELLRRKALPHGTAPRLVLQRIRGRLEDVPLGVADLIELRGLRETQEDLLHQILHLFGLVGAFTEKAGKRPVVPSCQPVQTGARVI
jgi:hypothetical protein